MDSSAFSQNYLNGLCSALQGLDSDAIGTAIDWLVEARDSGNTIYSCGNGGSASIASQMVVDIVKGASFQRERRIKMMALTDSVATITAYANDVDYADVFVEPLRNFAVAGDVLIAISGSGNSPNIVRAVEYAKEVGCRSIGMTTGEGGALAQLADLPLVVPSCHMGHLEDAFFVMTHVLVYAFIDRAVA